MWIDSLSAAWDRLDALQRVSAVLAVYGAGLASWTQYVQRRDKRPRIVVTLRSGIAVGGSAHGALLDVIHVANAGQVPVTIDGFSLELPDRHHLVFPEHPQMSQIPAELPPGSGRSFHVPRNDLLRGLLHMDIMEV